MSRRKTVKLNLEVVLPLIKEKCRSNVVFCEKMGRPTQKTWVTDWNRKDENGNPKPKNPPSPEEAAKMCILLETTPEVILLDKGATEAETAELQADIALVRDLLDQQRTKKAPTETSEREFVPSYEDWEKQAESWTLDQLDNAIWKLFQIKRKREGKHGE